LREANKRGENIFQQEKSDLIRKRRRSLEGEKIEQPGGQGKKRASSCEKRRGTGDKSLRSFLKEKRAYQLESENLLLRTEETGGFCEERREGRGLGRRPCGKGGATSNSWKDSGEKRDWGSGWDSDHTPTKDEFELPFSRCPGEKGWIALSITGEDG